jgi:hypothetical protein
VFVCPQELDTDHSGTITRDDFMNVEETQNAVLTWVV